MTLNGVMAVILRYFTEFDSFGGNRPIWCAQGWLNKNALKRLSHSKAKISRPSQQLSLVLI